ncbi:TlpA family protein disulfide reductase [Parabacteroides sp. 52]|uniref:TlpA family protein disulfide reductase n=1 Tax=unclassified Parabacteroides TaxID=2649774 RepID=UPI0013D3DBBB|nr:MULTISPECIES: TlpA disulfide reductase family protein [unclassified Parabacteroides]MDH6535499.1 peroxiredoxin [Parabacteroides sp. PM5-20]NDV55921.1 TlpA family protein disulfide reductase [Parabacteroides sp. 52]
MTYRFTLSLFLFSLFLLFTACVREDEITETINYITVGDKVPDFTVEDGTGGHFSSSQFVGKKSLLVFFNTTCRDCQRELPTIQSLWETKLKNNPDYTLVTIARGEEKSKTDSYWTEYAFTMPKYQDPYRKVFTLFANNTIPRFYFIDKEGIVKWMVIENLYMSSDQLFEKMEND